MYIFRSVFFCFFFLGFVVWLAALCLHLTCKQAGAKIRKVKVALSIFSLLLFACKSRQLDIAIRWHRIHSQLTAEQTRKTHLVRGPEKAQFATVFEELHT